MAALTETAGALVTFAGVFAVTYLLMNRRNKHSTLPPPPSLPCLPVVGSLPFIKGDNIAEFFMKTSKRLGSVFSFYAGPKYVVVVNGYGAIHEALVTRGIDFADRISFYVDDEVNPEGKGIVNRQYNNGFKVYKQLTLSILKDLGYGKSVMEDRIQKEVQNLIGHIRDTFGGRPFYPLDIVMGSIANLTLTLLYGRRYELTDPTLKKLVDNVEEAISNICPELDIFPILRYLPRYRRRTAVSVSAFRQMLEDADKFITDCLETKPELDSFVNRFAGLQGPGFDRTELLYVLRDLTIAGLDTSTVTLLWMIVLLANHHSVQDRLHAEIDTVVGRDRPPTLEDRELLPFVEATILETLRLKTTAPLAALHATHRDTSVGGQFIPSRAMVVVNLFGAHIDPDTWTQPEQFQPERFLDSSGKLTSLKYKVIAFSEGRRACLGEQLARRQLFLFVTGLLQQFNICPPEGQQRVDYTDHCAIVLAPSPYEVRFIPRM